MEKQNKFAKRILVLLYALIVLLLTVFGIYLFGFVPFFIEALILIAIPLAIVKRKTNFNVLIKALILVLPLVLWLGVRIYVASENRRLQLEILQSMSKDITELRENASFGVTVNLPNGWRKTEDKFNQASFEYGSSQIIFEKLANTSEIQSMSSNELYQALKEQLEVAELKLVDSGSVTIDGAQSTYIDTELTGIMQMKYVWTIKNGIVYNLAILINEEDKNLVDVNKILTSIKYE